MLDYGYSSAAYVTPLVLGPLGVEAVTAHAVAGDETNDGRCALRDDRPDEAARPAVGADLGAVFDRSAERLYLIDETGEEVGVERALLLHLRPARAGADAPGAWRCPVTVTSQADRLSTTAGSASSGRASRSPT